MTLFVANFNEGLTPQPGEERYVVRAFAGGIPLLQRFIAEMPRHWKIHSFVVTSLPIVLIEIQEAA